MQDKYGKNTYIHSEYLVLIAFARQQWLRERTLILCYTYVACLDIFINGQYVVPLFGSC